jgi:hypothetical protein
MPDSAWNPPTYADVVRRPPPNPTPPVASTPRHPPRRQLRSAIIVPLGSTYHVVRPSHRFNARRDGPLRHAAASTPKQLRQPTQHRTPPWPSASRAGPLHAYAIGEGRTGPKPKHQIPLEIHIQHRLQRPDDNAGFNAAMLSKHTFLRKTKGKCFRYLARDHRTRDPIRCSSASVLATNKAAVARVIPNHSTTVRLRSTTDAVLPFAPTRGGLTVPPRQLPPRQPAMSRSTTTKGT